mmetsp:Transcript_14242/g.36224  ORF Transcript_14242/g.36224 Transcript_14242/m.36224 type:complete len:231 (-) Transcript_14242:1227-1919(-)
MRDGHATQGRCTSRRPELAGPVWNAGSSAATAASTTASAPAAANAACTPTAADAAVLVSCRREPADAEPASASASCAYHRAGMAWIGHHAYDDHVKWPPATKANPFPSRHHLRNSMDSGVQRMSVRVPTCLKPFTHGAREAFLRDLVSRPSLTAGWVSFLSSANCGCFTASVHQEGSAGGSDSAGGSVGQVVLSDERALAVRLSSAPGCSVYCRTCPFSFASAERSGTWC